jgi:two-component system chemotaxis response regulator CheB
MALHRIRVLIVDDSPIERELIAAVLAEEPDLEVVGFASDGNEARTRIKALDPCVLTLDLRMEGMGGMRFLQNLMRLRPMPVVVCAGVEPASAEAREALAAGAMRFVSKSLLSGIDPLAFRGALVRALREAVYARHPRPASAV